ncbi:MAG: metal ABC transporter permease [Coriobacteriales bacterium]|jgi:zinc transport system permease protein|nr:metal ABC transporter permease [Coriobacteriales bacterium]
MLETLLALLSYPFLLRALVVGLLVSLTASLLGVSLVLKRYAMIGDGLAHVGFGALAIATVLHAAPLAVALPVVVLAAFLLLRVSERSQIKGDAAIALISTGALAVGVTAVSVSPGVNIDITNYLFGSILATSQSDLMLSIVLAVVVLVLFVLCYHKIMAVTFDETFARATGVNAGFYNALLALLTAVTIVLGMRMMGALLISSLLIFPALTSMRLARSFRGVTLCAASVAVLCFAVGASCSYLGDLPTGSTVVLVNIAAFLLFWTIRTLWRRTS